MTIDSFDQTITSQPTARERCEELQALVARHTADKGDGVHSTAISQLAFVKDGASTTICSVYEPSLAIIVQGKKKILLGETAHQYGFAQCLVVSVDLPVRGFIVEATPDQPYLCFLLKLLPLQLCELVSQVKVAQAQGAQAQPMAASPGTLISGLCGSDVDLPLVDCALRLTQLLDTPQDIPFLAPMVIREIYYRLLTGEQGDAVRQIATSDSAMQRIARVIERIKADFSQSLRVEGLAEQANMSTASFHRHFKAVTSMSPLQYQKHLRLLEARRLMLAQDSDATQAAYQVGYESPSQFSREYSRMFGAPPIQDIERLRSV